MSIPDGELEEPSDSLWCFTHESYRPCGGCRADEADRQYDTMKEAP